MATNYVMPDNGQDPVPTIDPETGLISLAQGDTLTLTDGAVVTKVATPTGTVTDGTFVYVSAGAAVNAAEINSKGTLRMYKGGEVSHATINNRGKFVMTGGTADYTTLNGVATFSISKAGTVTNTTVNNKGTMTLTDGNATTTEVSGPEALFTVGGATAAAIASDTELKRAAKMTVLNGGIAVNVTVNKGSTLELKAGGKLTGDVSFTPGIATISGDSHTTTLIAADGSIIDFDISTLDGSSTSARIKHLDVLTGNPDYTLTVKTGEQIGSYRLATNATAFDGLLTVYDKAGTELGTFDNYVFTEAATTKCNYTLAKNSSNIVTVTATPKQALVGGTDPDSFSFTTIADAVAASPLALTVTGSYSDSSAYVALNGISTTIDACTFTGSRFCGGHVLSDALGTRYGNYSMTINGGSFTGLVVGGDSINSETTSTGFVHDGTINLTINGGSFKNVAAGLLIQSEPQKLRKQLGDITVTVNGGTFRDLYGGNAASDRAYATAGMSKVEGSITINLNVNEEDITFRNLFAGSYGKGVVTRNTEVVITGDQTLTLEKLWGGCEGDSYKTVNGQRVIKSGVAGDRILTFNGFQGNLEISYFTGFNKINLINSVADFSLDEQPEVGISLADINEWNLDLNSMVQGYFGNTFADDKINLDLSSLDTSLEFDEITLFDCDNFGALKGFADAQVKFGNGDYVTFDANEGAFVDGKYSLAVDGKQMVFTYNNIA